MLSRTFVLFFCIFIYLDQAMAEKEQPTNVQTEIETGPVHIPGSNMIGAGRHARVNKNKGQTSAIGHGSNGATDLPHVIAGKNGPLPETQKHLEDGNK